MTVESYCGEIAQGWLAGLHGVGMPRGCPGAASLRRWREAVGCAEGVVSSSWQDLPLCAVIQAVRERLDLALRTRVPMGIGQWLSEHTEHLTHRTRLRLDARGRNSASAH